MQLNLRKANILGGTIEHEETEDGYTWYDFDDRDDYKCVAVASHVKSGEVIYNPITIFYCGDELSEQDLAANLRLIADQLDAPKGQASIYDAG